jgi:uncharacterized membrane protein (UPF0136 family)
MKENSVFSQYFRFKSLHPLMILSLVILVQQNLILAPSRSEQFLYLAKSFLDGHLYFTVFPGCWDDTAYYLGHHYWPLGPFPAVILMPFVWLFGWTMRQAYLQFMLNLLNLFLLYKIGRRITKNSESSWWLAFAYLFSTAYIFVALVPLPSYFAHVVATSCLLLALHEYLHGRRWWLIGLYTALGVTTRITLLIAGVFFVLIILLSGETKSRNAAHGLQFFLPVAAALLALFLYNFMRFGNPLEFGYALQLLFGEQAANRTYGLWSFVHFPANLYYFLFKGPEGIFLPGTKILTYPYLRPNSWGMSILFTSPIFLWISKTPKDTVICPAIITSLLMFFVLMGFHGIGVDQYGYRFALDFYPFLFLMLTYASKTGFSLSMKITTIASFLFNWFLIPSVFFRG